MANGAGTALGLSIGATNLAAATADNAITRKPVLTLYPDRPAEIGIPAENPGLQGPGVVVTGFVNRIGDPRGIVAPDGSVHRSEVLLADGLRALAYAATGGRPLPDDVAVTYPAHWGSPAVEALGAALSEIPEWSGRARPILLIPDAAATLLAVRAHPGIPARGTVAVCDFGGSGTNITLMDADGDYRALAPTVRHHDFSGDLIDQALLGVVVANMPTTGAFPTGTAAIGSLSRLRSGCRVAKEQLSSSTATTLTNGLTGARGEIRLARHELDDAIRPALTGFLARLDETLARNGIRHLVAVVATGGGANLPAVTTTLAQHFRVPVATTPRPQLAAAVGAALRVARGADDATSAAPAAPATATARAARPDRTATAQVPPANPAPMPIRAWSATAHQSRVIPDGVAPDADAATIRIAAPAARRKGLFARWRLLPAAALLITAAAVLLVGTALAVGLNSQDKSATTPAPALTTTPAAPAPQSATAEPGPVDVPVPSTSDTNPPAETETPMTTTPRATPQAAPPAPPMAPRRAALPPIPPIPGLNEPIPGLDRVNQIIQEIQGGLGINALPAH
ncbi:Hsp70 family protein [Mycobacterium sp. WUMAC-067]|uniref:Hsp70 family protein n=1 Tax=unclassified Mycobacterium TaxID=2642494 RepID=UPI001CDA3389|nr:MULTISPECIES: Hsp70 family protein [unclassified Mycobacterium]MCA2245571.1 Hsp70 family protein [Mycobacterium sp. WUMAC-067]MCA2315822.1 Hsp70 family protein [Mycobacterium sp. WUMAC-025]